MQISLYYISGLNQDIEELFFSFEFVSRSSFNNRHQISDNINLEISLKVYHVSFPPKIQKSKKTTNIETFTTKISFTDPNLK